MAGFKQRYGKNWKNVMYATATKQAMKEDSSDEWNGSYDFFAEMKEEVEQIDEATHGYKLKLTKTTHRKDITDDADNPVKAVEKHYEIHKNGKKVGNILHHYNEYAGHFYHADIHGKRVPFDTSKDKEGAHHFLNGVVNTKFYSNLKKEEFELDEEQLDEAPKPIAQLKKKIADYDKIKYNLKYNTKKDPLNDPHGEGGSRQDIKSKSKGTAATNRTLKANIKRL